MMIRSFSGILPRWYPQLGTWAWLVITLQLFSFANCLVAASYAADHPPRAALVALAHEHDLQPILSSIQQLEHTFNRRYQYDWIFFSTVPLSDEFRRRTSNATSATCIFEVIPHDNWGVPQWAPYTPPFGPQLAGNPGQGFGDEFQQMQPVPRLRQIYRWNSGSFAKEDRLRSYDWFWRIEPGAQFTHNIHFDIFRFMRDHGIAYGMHKAATDGVRLQTLSQQVKSFIDKHPDLLHADADVSWLLDNSDAAAGSADYEGGGDGEDVDDGFLDQPGRTAVFAGSVTSLADSEADGLQRFDIDEEGMSSPTEAFAFWLSSIYKTGISPTFEVGSLAFFRSSSHQVLLDHLDSAGDLYYEGPRDMLVPSLSASMFLPQKSVWGFRKRETRPSPAESTPDPELNLDGLDDDDDNTNDNDDNGYDHPRPTRTEPALKPKNEMAECFTLWEQMARDLDRQDSIPGLISGSTVIDERNFVLMWHSGRTSN